MTHDRVVRYALTAAAPPIAVADYTYATLPRPASDALPTAAELADVVDSALSVGAGEA